MAERLWVTDTVPSSRFPVYTRANSGEVYAGVLKPLGWTTSIGWPSERGWRDALVRYGAFDPDEFDDTQPELVASFGGYIFLNLSAQRTLGARTPGVEPDDVDRAFFGETGGAPKHVRSESDDDPRYAARVTDTCGWIMTTPGVPDVDAFRKAVGELRNARPDLGAMTSNELVDHVRFLLSTWYDPIIALHFFIINCATVPTGLVQATTARIGRPDLAMRLISAFGDVDSAKPANTMRDIAAEVDQSSILGEILDVPSGSRWRSVVNSAHPEARGLREQLDRFLLDFGAGGPDPYDVTVDSWETNPELVMSAISGMRNRGQRARQDGADDRSRAMDEVRKLLDDSADELAQLEAAVAASAVWIPARERSKTTMTRLLNEIRMAVFELGRNAMRAGVVESVAELAMLTVDELPMLAEDRKGARELIDDRTLRYEQLSAKMPPFFVDGTVPLLETWTDRRDAGSRDVVVAQPGDTLKGLPGCPGTATGVARVATGSPDIELNDGEVLVAPYTDAGWAPLFLAAAAVVVDVGAPLSHAAIISRELGVPCVVSCSDATRRIPDGALITVDGTNGLVYVH